MKYLLLLFFSALLLFPSCKKDKQDELARKNCQFIGSRDSTAGNVNEIILRWENGQLTTIHNYGMDIAVRHGDHYVVTDGERFLGNYSLYFDYDSTVLNSEGLVDAIYTRASSDKRHRDNISRFFYKDGKASMQVSAFYRDENSEKPAIDTTYYTWENDNLIRVQEGDYVTTYEYDLTRQANDADASRYAQLVDLGVVWAKSKNLRTAKHQGDVSLYYSYEYDKYGRITRMTTTYTNADHPDKTPGGTSDMRYYCE